MQADPDAGFVTVDAENRPRIRSVRAWLLDVHGTDSLNAMTVWVLSLASSRKIRDIEGNHHVALYFDDDEAISYLSISGTAILHRDPDDPKVRAFLDDEETKSYFWPEFPAEFVVVEVRPRWLEFMSLELPPEMKTWQPQAVVFLEE